MSSPLHLDPQSWRLAVCLLVFLAAVHAYRKLSPYFAVTWFGSGLVFGWVWAQGPVLPETLLLPVGVIYLAAALTKGLVEQGRFAGNHVLHVALAGLLTAVVAAPLEAAARAMGWPLPRGAPALLPSELDGPWLGDVPADVLLQWLLLGSAFYGLYKLLDHSGLGVALRTLLLFAAMPFLPAGVEAVWRALQ